MIKCTVHIWHTYRLLGGRTVYLCALCHDFRRRKPRAGLFADGPAPCRECDGRGYMVAEMDTFELPDGLLWHWACEYCNGTGNTFICFTCGRPLQLVRPGKWQCGECG